MYNHPSSRPRRRAYLWATLLIGVPVLALLAVPLYARTEPTLFAFPMFYWWTFVWIAALSAGIGAAFHLLERGHDDTTGAERRTSTEMSR